MTENQEIRARALQLAIQYLAIAPNATVTPAEAVETAKWAEDFIRSNAPQTAENLAPETTVAESAPYSRSSDRKPLKTGNPILDSASGAI